MTIDSVFQAVLKINALSRDKPDACKDVPSQIGFNYSSREGYDQYSKDFIQGKNISTATGGVMEAPKRTPCGSFVTISLQKSLNVSFRSTERQTPLPPCLHEEKWKQVIPVS
ncbi:hypothetical protein FEK66_23250 [Escherichia sp. E1130]|nr:hypothetical protein FEK66_23250 [Escherichia sp. E1130]